MSRTYNGRFPSPPEPPSGAKWLVGGLLMIPAWSIPLVGMGVLAGSVCCFVKAGKMGSRRRMHRRFHEMCAVIGMRERVSIRELAKVGEMSKNEMRQYLQKMIAEGYFGEGATLDVNRDELVLPSAQGKRNSRSPISSWKDIVFDILDALKGERAAQQAEPRAAKPAETPPKQPVEEKSAPEGRKTNDVRKNYMDELERTLNELYQLNAQIEDAAVSQRIDRIGALTAGIFRAVIDNPEREQDVRKFMNYYLPTTLKLLKSYDLLENQSYQGENIAASRKKIENVLDMLIEAYEKQLDRLFKNDALDIAADIDVLETMMAGDGLSGKGQMKMM